MPKKLTVTIAEAAKKLGITEDDVVDHIGSGKLGVLVLESSLIDLQAKGPEVYAWWRFRTGGGEMLPNPPSPSRPRVPCPPPASQRMREW
jgi:hypothetical protein